MKTLFKWTAMFAVAIVLTLLTGASSTAHAFNSDALMLVGFAGMINVIREPVSINFGAVQQRGDLAQGIFLEKLQIVINAVVNIAGGAANGTIVTDGVARLIRRLTVRWDNETIVDISGRDLLTLTRASSKAAVTGTQLASAAVGSENISLTLILPFARPWLINPFETVLPPLRVNNMFAVLVDWEQGISGGAGSEAGSAAIITGGDRVVTFSTDPTITITQYGAQRGKAPWFLPYYSSFDTDQFSAANPRLQFRLQDARRFDSVFISPRQGALASDADLLNFLTLSAQGVNFMNGIRAEDLRSDQRQQFAASGTDLNFYLLLSEGGWLGNSVEPTQMVKPLFTFDVDAPGSAPGVVHLLFSELVTHPQWTQVQGQGNS